MAQPITATHDVVVQDQTTGAVDYLQFQGTKLAASAQINYGIAGFNIVANGDFNGDGHPDLVAQSRATGQLDFLFLDGSANLVSSVLTWQQFGTVHGSGVFGNPAAGQVGGELVSQTADGSIDLLAFGGNGNLVASFLVPNTAGLPTIVGVAASPNSGPAFQGTGTTSNIVVQYGNGTLDALGFTGDFNNGTLTFSASYVLPNTKGTSTIVALDQDFDANNLHTDGNTSAFINGGFHETVDMVTMSGDAVKEMFYDSGYNEIPNEGALMGYLTESGFSLPTGWAVVDGGMVAHNDFFPVS